jgi:endonuclease YncB( thermonuclease family)
MRAHIALVLTLVLAPPVVAETIVGRASVINGDAIEVRAQPIRLDGVDAPEGAELCDEGNETNYRCGVGTEWAVTDRVSVKSEAVYLRLQDDSVRRSGQISGPGDAKRFDPDYSVWIGRIGVSFKLEGKARQAQ